MRYHTGPVYAEPVLWFERICACRRLFDENTGIHRSNLSYKKGITPQRPVFGLLLMEITDCRPHSNMRSGLLVFTDFLKQPPPPISKLKLFEIETRARESDKQDVGIDFCGDDFGAVVGISPADCCGPELLAARRTLL